MDPQIYYLSNYGAQAIATPICSQTALEGSDNGDVYEEKKNNPNLLFEEVESALNSMASKVK